MLRRLHGQLGDFPLAHQRTFGYQGAANTARDGGRHRCIAQVDACGFHGGLGRCQIGFGLLLGGHGRGVVLFADGIGFHQGLVAIGQGCGLGQRGFGACYRGLCALQCGAVGRSIDFEQRLAGLDVAALTEQSLEQDARDASTDFGGARGLDAARQFSDQGHIRGLGDNHAHLGRGRFTACMAGWLVALATGCQCQERCQSQCANHRTAECKRRGEAVHGHPHGRESEQPYGWMGQIRTKIGLCTKCKGRVSQEIIHTYANV